MRLLPPLAAALGVVILGYAIVTGGACIAEREASVTVEQFELDETDMEEPALETQALPEEQQLSEPGRAVAPSVAPPVIDGPLQREEPRAPLSELSLAMPRKPGVPEPTLLHKPVAVAAGRIEASGHTVDLTGIKVLDADATCAGPSGGAWPCGMIARTAFRSWLRGRAVSCIVAEPPPAVVESSACHLGKQDVALWLVENGYAEATPGGSYAKAGLEAKRDKRGMFGTGPTQ